MTSWSKAKSGDNRYNIRESGGKHTVFKDDATFFRTDGTKVGSADSKDTAIDLVKSDSGSKNVDIKKST
jgi:hypothetical protein